MYVSVLETCGAGPATYLCIGGERGRVVVLDVGRLHTYIYMHTYIHMHRRREGEGSGVGRR